MELQNEKARILLVDQETFKKAVAYAISREQVKDPSIPDPYKSEEVNGVVLLRSSSSTIIAKVPIEGLAEMTPEKVGALIATGSAPIRKADFSGSPQERAVAWATSMGYPIPTKMGGCLASILVVIGLCIYIVPGVLLLIWIWVQSNQYERDMKALVEKWVDAGRPNAGEGIKEVTRLERIVEKVETPPASSSSTEQRLEELNSMKEKGLITDEEYQAMRKKALGL